MTNFEQALKEGLEDFNRDITEPFPKGKYKNWGIHPSQLLAIYKFINLFAHKLKVAVDKDNK